MSRIRPRQHSKELSLGSDLADLMLLGNWEESEETELKNVVQIRNRIAHNQVVSEDELHSAQTFLRNLLRRLKGQELG